jgi:hypothetical protein
LGTGDCGVGAEIPRFSNLNALQNFLQANSLPEPRMTFELWDWVKAAGVTLGSANSAVAVFPWDQLETGCYTILRSYCSSLITRFYGSGSGWLANRHGINID